jgi:hypothetical protein
MVNGEWSLRAFVLEHPLLNLKLHSRTIDHLPFSIYQKERRAVLLPKNSKLTFQPTLCSFSLSEE